MAILVTGGCGYIGSVITELLVEAGREVVVLDDGSRGHRQAVHRAAQLVVASVGDATTVENLLRRCKIEAVIHLAALIEAGESVTEPASYYQTNLVDTLQLLRVLRAGEVTKFVFSSSAAVYGEAERMPIEETAATLPSNPYGETKLAVERALAWYAPAYGLRYVSLRYFNAAGATKHLGEDHHPETHLIPRLLEAALGRLAVIPIFGRDFPTADGTCIRDYIHIEDLARAHLLALGKLEQGSGHSGSPESNIFNLGNGQGFSVLEVVEATRRVTGREIRTQDAPRRAGDPPALVASCRWAQAALGWKPEFTQLESIIESAWRWKLEHPNGYAE